MKCVILAGGRGSRIKRDMGYSPRARWNKCLLPVAGKPLICYSLENACSLFNDGLIDSPVIIVYGYGGKMLRKFIGDQYGALEIVYVRQSWGSALGAIYASRRHVHKDPFLLMLGDEILIKPRLNEMIAAFHSSDLDGILGYKYEPDIGEVKRTYSIEMEGSLVKRVVEKPKDPNSNLKGTGNCILPNSFYLWIPYVEKVAIQDFVSCVQYGINLGYRFGAYEVCSEYFNINTLEDLKGAREYFKAFS